MTALLAVLDSAALYLSLCPEAAWLHFVGWRLNYEPAAYALAEATDAVPVIWSGPRRRPSTPLHPLRPMPGNHAI